MKTLYARTAVLDHPTPQDIANSSDDQDLEFTSTEDEFEEWEDEEEDGDFSDDDPEAEDEDEDEDEPEAPDEEVAPELEASRFAQALPGSVTLWTLPVNILEELSAQSQIPGCDNGNINVRASAVEWDGHLVCNRGGWCGIGGEWEFYDIGDLAQYPGPVFERWHDEEAIHRGGRDRRTNAGAIVTVRGRKMVVLGVIKVTMSLPSAEGGCDLGEAEKDSLGWALSRLKENGAVFTYRQVGAFPVLTISEEEKTSHFIYYKVRRKYCSIWRTTLSPEQLTELEKAPVAESGGQLCFF